jgi:hypothetical protein
MRSTPALKVTSVLDEATNRACIEPTRANYRQRVRRSYPFFSFSLSLLASNLRASSRDKKRYSTIRAEGASTGLRRCSRAGPQETVTIRPFRPIFQIFQLTPLRLLEFRPMKKKRSSFVPCLANGMRSPAAGPRTFSIRSILARPPSGAAAVRPILLAEPRTQGARSVSPNPAGCRRHHTYGTVLRTHWSVRRARTCSTTSGRV